MFRFSHVVVRASNLMLRRSPVEIRVAYLSRTRALYKTYKRLPDKERDTCPPKPPPKEVTKEDGVFWGTIALLLVAGVFTVFAKGSVEIRDWITIQAPWLDDFIAAVHEENRPFLEAAKDFGDSVVKYIVSKFEPLPEECTMGPPAVVPITAEDLGKTPVAAIGADDDDDDDDDDEDDEGDEYDDDDSDPLCTVLKPPIVTKDVCEIERCLKELTDSMYNNYLTARDACVYYNKLVDATLRDFDLKTFRTLQEEMEIKEELFKKHTAKAEKIAAIIESFKSYLECGVDVPKDRLAFTKSILKGYEDKAEIIRIDSVIQHNFSETVDVQWQIIRDQINMLIEQETSTYPELNYDHDKPEIGGNLDLLLLLAKKHVESLTEKVMDSRPAMAAKGNAALAVANMTKEQKEKELNAAYTKAKTEMANEYATRMNNLNAKLEKDRRDVLEQQRKKHEADLASKVAIRTKQFDDSFDKRVAAAVAIEKRKFDLDLKEMEEKVAIVEDKLNKRLKAESETKRAQELYAASASLLQATKKGSPTIKVEKELKTIKRLAIEEDKLVNTILKSIPTQVWNEGIVPESVLRERYHMMEDVALKVAMLEAEGGPLPLYAMSWLQSMLLFMKMATIPQKEIDHPPEEPFEGLDTFDLLQRARYFVERGNLAKAVRYVDSLEGASRGAADAWFNAASAHVQTRQAAEAILAHAAAMNVRYL